MATRSPRKGKKYPPEPLSKSEVVSIIEQIDTDSWRGIRDHAIIVTLYRSGLRIDECLNLYPRDIFIDPDGENHSITVRNGKGSRRRVVGFDAKAVESVAKWLERRAQFHLGDDIPVFCNLDGTRLTAAGIRKKLARWARLAGIAKRVHPHGLRHTHAVELARENVPIPIIQNQLGHRNIATTHTYLNHLDPKEVIHAVNRREW